MKILVFLHGTSIMHASAIGWTRQQRVQQVLDGDPGVKDFSSYVPTDGAVAKLRSWAAEGAKIQYLSSHRKAPLVDTDKAILRDHGFPEGEILSRGASGAYAQVVEDVMPDVLLEDDCESLGGPKHMAFPNLRPEMQARIKSIVVPEFGGLHQLPDDLSALGRI